MAKKYHKLGVMLDGQYGPFIVLGDTKNNQQQFQFSVQFRKLGPDGKTVVDAKNGMVKLQDPRQRKGITEAQAAKIPNKLLYELVFVEEVHD